MHLIFDFVQAEVLSAQASHEATANRRRHPARRYEPGQLVWLDSRNIHTLRPRKKLDWKNLGPFTVKRVVSAYAYELVLPPTIRIHPVFHVNLLRPAASNPVPGQHNPHPRLLKLMMVLKNGMPRKS